MLQATCNGQTGNYLNTARLGLVALSMALSAFAVTAVGQTTVWVDDDGDDTLGQGTEASPWQTISFATNQVSAGDTIKVKPGTYDDSLGENSPIAVPNRVLITGSETAQANWPRVGGDVTASRTFEIIGDSSTGGRSGSKLERLYFLGQDEATEDAPIAVYIKATDGENVRASGVTNCYFERPEMNDATSTNDVPVILVETGKTSNTDVLIESSTIFASVIGGIQMRPLPGAHPEETSSVVLTVRDCSIDIEGTDKADFGILIGGDADDIAIDWIAKIVSTEVDSTGVTTPGTDGIETGIDLHLSAADGHIYKIRGNDSAIRHCVIQGCRGDGVRIRLDSDLAEGSNTNIVLNLSTSVLQSNGGAGVHLDWNDLEDEGYIQFKSYSNLVADNNYGYLYENFNADIAGNVGSQVNDTIAYNTLEGLYFDGSAFRADGAPAPSLENCVVWENNSGSAQYGDTTLYNPCQDSGLSYSDWMNYSSISGCSGTSGNIDSDPYFADSSNGDYHLTSSSTTVIDSGDNFASAGLSQEDVDGDDRIIDGDSSGSATVDMGADEYDP